MQGKLIISGTASGLGKYLHCRFGGLAWTRQLPEADRQRARENGVETIIHCAFNSRGSVTSETLHDYLADNLYLTQELAAVPHRKFIFISTVDVYPKIGHRFTEAEPIDVNAVSGIYALSKLMSESVVRSRGSEHLILRCSALLGPDIRRNSLIKILEDDPCILTLRADSRFNYILHEDLADFIEFAMQNGLGGTYNAASNETVTLAAVAAEFGKTIRFGSFRYDAGDIDNRKIAVVFPAFQKNSLAVIKQFANRR